MYEQDYINTLKKVMRKLNGSHLPAIAVDTNLPVRWLRKLVSGEIKRPRQARLIKLADYFNIK